jgi:hypothetical protein
MIVKTRCSVHKKAFATVFAETTEGGGVWEAQDAFELTEERAQQGYGQGAITGSISISSDYPGCPYCGSQSLFLCSSCDDLNCLGDAVDEEDGRISAVCASCGRRGYLMGPVRELDGFDDV